MATIDPSEYKTGNPVSSNKAEDLSDNARVMDVFVNASAAEKVLDRLGRPLPTIKLIESQAKDAFRLAASDNKGNYAVGVEYSKSNDTYTYNGQEWGLSVDFDLSLLPYPATQADPSNDPNLSVYKGASESFVRNEIDSSKKVFSTLSDALASSSITLGDDVETRFQNAQIVQQWKVVASDPSPEYGKQAANGLWLQEVSNVKYYESFGAFGNGTDLDDDAFEFAHSYNGKTNGRFGSEYLVSKQHDLTNSATIYGGWAKVKLQGNAKFAVINSNCRLGELDLDGLDGDHTAYAVQIASPSENAKVGDMIYRNFHGSTSTQTYPLMIPAYGSKDFECGNQSFYNILQDDDGAVTGKGFVGGVYLVGLDVDVPNGKSNGKVGNVYGDVVKSVDAGSGVVQDSDLVRVYAETEELLENFDIEFGDVTGRNIHKRIVKASYLPGIRFGNVTSFNPQEASEVYTLFAAVETIGNARNLKFGNVEVNGPSDRVVNIKGNGISFGDIYDNAGCQAVILGDSSTAAISCSIGDVLGRGSSVGSSQGIGVRIINSNLCNVGGVTGRFAISAQTEDTNTGRTTISEITTAGRIAISHGSVTINNVSVDLNGETVGGTHIVLGANARIGTSEIITDGRVTVGIAGSAIDVDLGRMRIVRKTALNGNESSHSVFTTASAIDGILRGNLEIEVNASVDGTPSGSSGKTLAYFTGLNIDDFSLSMNVTASDRGATGLNTWFNTVNGQANRVAIKSAMSLVGSKFDGNMCIDKLENLVSGGSAVTCTGEVNAPIVEKRTDGTIAGLANTPVMTINSTR